jgi:hypothetical protein
VAAVIGHELGAVHVKNRHHPLAADPSLFASDRVHGNARGHAIAAANLLRALASPTVAGSRLPHERRVC